jgi:hypothetical protein
VRVIGLYLNAGQDVQAHIDINRLPDTCPICHSAGAMKVHSSYVRTSERQTNEKLQITLQCPKQDCRKFFIAYYSLNSQTGSTFSAQYSHSKPQNYAGTDFPENIVNISSEFITIYNQAEKAEADGLDKIAGVGYRKSFEFLIKDYLISKAADEVAIDAIKAKALGNCISQDISNDNIKTVAARATWLGNDETHYSRIWTDRDIDDLKQLIKLSVYWIDSEIMTSNLIQEMPNPNQSASSPN